MKKQSTSQTISEVDIQKSICAYLTLRKVFFYRNNNVGIYDAKKKRYRSNRGKYSKKGVSDIVGIYKGVPLYIEVKSAKGKASKDQERFLEEVEKEGGIAFVARCVRDVVDHLEKYDL